MNNKNIFFSFYTWPKTINAATSLLYCRFVHGTVHPLYGTDMLITTHTRDTEVDMFMAATDALLQYRTVLYSRDCLLYRNRLMCTRDSPLLLILSNHYYGKSFYMLPNQTLPYRLLYQIPRQPLCCFATLYCTV